MDSRLAVLARMEDSSPRPRVRFLSCLLILHLNSAVEPFKSDVRQKISEKKSEIVLLKKGNQDKIILREKLAVSATQKGDHTLPAVRYKRLTILDNMPFHRLDKLILGRTSGE